MTSTIQDPISQEWTIRTDGSVSARELCRRLGAIEPVDLAEHTPAMAAAAAELALLVGIPWRFSADDPPIALLRMIARAAITAPAATGPHCDRLAAQLTSRLPPAL